jgi:protein-disulfide isomerase
VNAAKEREPKSARRRFLAGLACASAIGLVGATVPALAQTDVPMDQLMAPGALPDVVEGKADAPVTIVEYASMTCVHCAAFHEQTWPALKSKYIDNGKAKFILREFPLDPLAAAAFMLARCAGPDKRDAIVDLLFTQQKQWAFVDKPLEALAGVVKQAGISQADFETCLKNQDLYDQVTRTRDQAGEKFHVNATPTFFVNGKRLNGELPIAEFDKAIEPLLK